MESFSDVVYLARIPALLLDQGSKKSSSLSLLLDSPLGTEGDCKTNNHKIVLKIVNLIIEARLVIKQQQFMLAFSIIITSVIKDVETVYIEPNLESWKAVLTFGSVDEILEYDI